jgi:hypothetical protein
MTGGAIPNHDDNHPAIAPSSADRLASHRRSTTPLTCAWCGTSYRSIVKLLDHVDCCHLPDESSAASTLTRRLTAA